MEGTVSRKKIYKSISAYLYIFAAYRAYERPVLAEIRGDGWSFRPLPHEALRCLELCNVFVLVLYNTVHMKRRNVCQCYLTVYGYGSLNPGSETHLNMLARCGRAACAWTWNKSEKNIYIQLATCHT